MLNVDLAVVNGKSEKFTYLLISPDRPWRNGFRQLNAKKRRGTPFEDSGRATPARFATSF
jgi:hypothetical protein